jgi:hypothetical protein
VGGNSFSRMFYSAMFFMLFLRSSNRNKNGGRTITAREGKGGATIAHLKNKEMKKPLTEVGGFYYCY